MALPSALSSLPAAKPFLATFAIFLDSVAAAFLAAPAVFTVLNPLGLGSLILLPSLSTL